MIVKINVQILKTIQEQQKVATVKNIIPRAFVPCLFLQCGGIGKDRQSLMLHVWPKMQAPPFLSYKKLELHIEVFKVAI